MIFIFQKNDTPPQQCCAKKHRGKTALQVPYIILHTYITGAGANRFLCQNSVTWLVLLAKTWESIKCLVYNPYKNGPTQVGSVFSAKSKNLTPRWTHHKPARPTQLPRDAIAAMVILKMHLRSHGYTWVHVNGGPIINRPSCAGAASISQLGRRYDSWCYAKHPRVV